MKCKIYLVDGKTPARWDKGTGACDEGRGRAPERQVILGKAVREQGTQ